jgi:hypothetical protein
MKPTLVFLTALAVSAQTSEQGTAELTTQMNNPVAAMISVPIQNEFYLGVGPNRSTVYATQFKPVVPFAITPKWNLLTRYILPIAYVPDLFGGVDFLPQNRSSGSTFGNGDLTFTSWLTPSRMPEVAGGRVLIAAGTALMLPTATSASLGTGRWNGGPSAVAGYMKGRYIAGSLVQNVWSFAGPEERQRVNQFMVQPFWSYRLEKGWSVLVSPPITANWRGEDRWTVPISFGVSKLVRFSGKPVTFGVEAAHYTVRTSASGPRWALRFNTKFVLPR